METPSLVLVGAPHFFSRTTLRPRAPRVTLTASARMFRPRSRPRRASSSNAMILAITAVVLSGQSLRMDLQLRCPRRTIPARQPLYAAGPGISPQPGISLAPGQPATTPRPAEPGVGLAVHTREC